MVGGGPRLNSGSNRAGTVADRRVGPATGPRRQARSSAAGGTTR